MVGEEEKKFLAIIRHSTVIFALSRAPDDDIRIIRWNNENDE